MLGRALGLVGSAVQFRGVGGGAQAATFVVLTLILGVEKEPAAVASIVLWLLGFAGCCIAGLPLLFREGWSMGELRRMARESEKAEEAVLLSEIEHALVDESVPAGGVQNAENSGAPSGATPGAQPSSSTRVETKEPLR